MIRHLDRLPTHAWRAGTAAAASAALPAAADVRYGFDVPPDARARIATGWLALGSTALAASGVLALLLVLARTPGLSRLVPAGDFFRTALIAHVDLSVLVWFLAFAGALFSLNSTARWMPLARAALGVCAIGVIAIAAAPFVDPGAPVMANYVPVIDGPVFLGGLVAFGAGIGLLVLRGLFASPRVGVRLDGDAALRFGLNAALVAVAVALLAQGWSQVAVPRGLEPKAYYELLFWGGGHVLQFAWTLLLLFAWLKLADAIGARVPLSPRVVVLIFALQLAAVFATPLIYLAYDIPTVEHHRLHTWLMRFGGAIAIPPVGAAVLWSLRSRRGTPLDGAQRPLRAALLVSIFLTGLGGSIGFLIRGSNVTIPAHYHGAIVGITLAMMGVSYWLLPRLGFGAPPARLATWQPWVYGVGQLLHVTGLLWSGGYGVQRKVAGGEQVLRTTSEIAGMGLMGLGGLVAIAGGLLYVVAVVVAVRRRPARGAWSTW